MGSAGAGALAATYPAGGLTRFAQGGGSSGFSGRNRWMFGSVNEREPAALLLNLLTAREQRAGDGTRDVHFDIGRLADLPTAIFP